jgi:hypothetical protein
VIKLVARKPAALSGPLNAYETQPNMPINAGQTGSNADPAEGTSTGDVPELEREKPEGSLGVLALGVGGLPLWRSRD